MVSSGRPAIACILLIAGIAICSQAQTNTPKESTATISGKVTAKGKGVPGVIVIAEDPTYRGGWDRARYRTRTDPSGTYRISNLPAGRYRVSPHAAAFALVNEQAINTPVNIGDGETVEDINFELVRGGVITGKVTDADGQPLIDQSVMLVGTDPETRNIVAHERVQTDDRGIYRAFGLRQGKYKVSAGDPGNRLPGNGMAHKLTFHPSTTDETKATLIEVSEGTETKDVDIVMAGRAPAGFKVTGRILDGETGKPLPNVMYGISHHYGEGGSSSTSGQRANAAGEFRFENVIPGKYSVFIQPDQNSEFRANPVPFEVTDHDVTGLLIKTVKGATLSGVVVVEGWDERRSNRRLDGWHIYATVADPEFEHFHNTAVSVMPDGSFKLTGVRGGTIQLAVASMGRFRSREFSVLRVERDGVVQPNAINIKDGEHIGGLRVVLRQLTGAIRGQVKIEDGELPPSATLLVTVALVGENPLNPERFYRNAEVDARGRFHIEGLAAGRYEVRVDLYSPRPNSTGRRSKQEVSVADDTVSEVVLTLKLKTDPDEEDDDP